MLAAQKQGGYHKMYQILMTGGPAIDEGTLRAAATRAGLDAERLMREMTAPEITGRINDNLALGRRLDLQGTPAYIIGDQVLPGAVDLPTLVAAVANARRKPQ
jgi:protein-disulfide isomerase